MDLSKVDSLLVSFQRNIETGFKFLLNTQIGKKNHKNVSTANIRKLTKEIYFIYIRTIKMLLMSALSIDGIDI